MLKECNIFWGEKKSIDTKLLRLLFKSNFEAKRELKKIYYVVVKTNDDEFYKPIKQCTRF